MGMVLHVGWKVDTFGQVKCQKMVILGTNRVGLGDRVARCPPVDGVGSTASGCSVSSSSIKRCV
ncbi:hypothetical protein CsSME_00031339 [Camellia sinensis var. sinensis]